MLSRCTPCLLMLSLLAVNAAYAGSVLTTASNARLRETPGTDAATIATLPLGRTLEAGSPGSRDGWIHVTDTSAGLSGWVHESLVTPVDAATSLDVAMAVMDARLARSGDGLPARMELLAFIERTLAAQEDRAIAGQLQLRRLQALQQVLHAIPHNRSRWSSSLQQWISEREHEIRYNEPGGQWMLRPAHLHSLQELYRDLPVAEEIGWLAVETGLGGECEGDLVCYLLRLDAVEGEYLRRHPSGSHASEAMAQIGLRVDDLMAEQPISSRLFFSADEQCTPMQDSIAALQAAVMGSRAAEGATLATKLRSFTCAHAESISRPNR